MQIDIYLSLQYNMSEPIFTQSTLVWISSVKNFTFSGPCIVNIFVLIYFKRDATLHILFISEKLLYMFRVVSSPIIRSTYNCIYSIWYLLTVRDENKLLVIYSYPLQLTSTRYCKYSYMCSWWWVKIPPEHVEQFPRNKLCNVASLWKYIKTNIL